MITLIEPLIGGVLSSVAKRAIGESWKLSHTLAFILESFVDYVILTLIVFVAHDYHTKQLKFSMLGEELVFSKYGWGLVLLLVLIIAVLFWKQGRKQLFNGDFMRDNPNWILGMAWTIPNFLIVYVLTKFIFEVSPA